MDRTTCLICEKPAILRAGFCHTHGERWRRWGKPDPVAWATAFIAGKLNTCEICGKGFNGYFRKRTCSKACDIERRRRIGLANYHARPVTRKREDAKRASARSRAKRAANRQTKRCVICRAPFVGWPKEVLCGLPKCTTAYTTAAVRKTRQRQAEAAIAVLAAELNRRK